MNYAIEKDFSEWRDWELNELKILVHVLFLRRNMKNLMDDNRYGNKSPAPKIGPGAKGTLKRGAGDISDSDVEREIKQQ